MTYTPSINTLAGILLNTGQETFPRNFSMANTALSNANMRVAVFRARKTETTTQVRFAVATAAAGGSTGVTSAYVALYTVAADGAMTRVAITADIDTSLNSTGLKTVPWSSSYAITAGSLLAVGIGATFDSTTAPAVSCVSGASQGECAILPPVALLLALNASVPATSYSAATVAASTTFAAPYVAVLP